MPIVWREQLSVGNDVIDNDHKHLIDLINKIERALSTKNRDELAAALDDLARYAMVHFDREEKIAKAAGFKHTENLGLSHQALFERFTTVRNEFDQSASVWSEEAAGHFLEFLRDWLIGHVIKEDLLMKPTLQRLSPSFIPG